jgi:hypothetical protein
MEINLNELYGSVDLALQSVGVPPYKPGRSIVTRVYSDELASGYVLMRELAIQKVDLPIEIFFRKGELSLREQAMLMSPNPHNITVKEITGKAKDFVTPHGHRAGWSTKVYAVFESEYAENLWIDSDSFPIRNPEFLFDDPEYKQKGSLFWRDVFSTDRANRYFDNAPIWTIFKIDINDAEPFESGQFLVNKPQCWFEMNLVKHYAENCEIYYHFGGDAETWRMAWQYCHQMNGKVSPRMNYHMDTNGPYGFIPYGPFHKGPPNQYGKWGGGTVMVQRDRQGLELFNHRNIHKFKIGQNEFYNDITNESRYHESVNLLNVLFGINQ